MSVRNRVGKKKIDTERLETETKFANNIADIQSDNIKNMNTVEIKLSSIA